MLHSFIVTTCIYLFTVAAANNAEESVANKVDGQQILKSDTKPLVSNPQKHDFTLRHILHHGAYSHPRLYRRKDIPKDQPLWVKSDDLCAEYVSLPSVQSDHISMQRLSDRRPSVIESIMAAPRQGSLLDMPATAWSIDSVLAPNVTDKDTVLAFARMAIDAYYINDTCLGWDHVGGGFNSSAEFGWEGDGLRGHVFTDQTNSTVVISIKGTSKALWDGDGTTKNDKINDNLFGSCCCGQQGAPTSRQVCTCATSTYTCNNTCVIEAIQEENKYYTSAKYIYANITLLYPTSNIWLVGHSLGGTVSSLLGLTYGLPAITFEAVPDALAASRLGLPLPPSYYTHQARDLTGAFHFGNTADPVYMGTCNGWLASCSLWGYAFESQCHTGKRCVYDVVKDKGWRVDIRKHILRTVIDEIIEKYETVPECAAEPECMDCFNWKYFEGDEPPSTTTSISLTSSSIIPLSTSSYSTLG